MKYRKISITVMLVFFLSLNAVAGETGHKDNTANCNTQKHSLMRSMRKAVWGKVKNFGITVVSGATTGTLLYFMLSYASPYGFKVINKTVNPSVPFRDIHGIPGYEILTRNNYLYIVSPFVEQLNHAVSYADAMPSNSNSSYAPARSAFIMTARIALLYKEDVFQNSFENLTDLMPGLKFYIGRNSNNIPVSVHINYVPAVTYAPKQMEALDLDIRVTDPDLFICEWSDNLKKEKGTVR
jgi:hypothetical protein